MMCIVYFLKKHSFVCVYAIFFVPLHVFVRMRSRVCEIRYNDRLVKIQ